MARAELRRRTGLFVDAGNNMGLDVITVISGNHMFPAVNLDDATEDIMNSKTGDINPLKRPNIRSRTRNTPTRGFHP